MNTVQTIAAVIENLRALFKDKDRLVGVDDWDNFIGCLAALEEVGNELVNQMNQTQAKEQAEEHTDETIAEG